MSNLRRLNPSLQCEVELAMAILPAIFFGHGNPMNALLHNAFTEGWAKIGDKIPRPQAVLCISAHWYVTSAV
jgi:aromatic ring-opening dioxygenase catalytic subunit (LigB family)